MAHKKVAKKVAKKAAKKHAAKKTAAHKKPMKFQKAEGDE